jgi:nitroreductase
MRVLTLRWRLGSTAVAVMIALALAAGAGAAPGALATLALGGAAQALAVAAAAAGALFALLWAVVRLALAPSAAGAEGLLGPAALRRSARLMGAAPGERFGERPAIRVSAIFFVTFLLALAVSGLAALPRAALSLAFGRGGGGPLPPLPLAAELVVGLLEAVGNAVVQPFGLVALTVFYFDRRARREGLDLEQWARGLAHPEAQ